MDDVVSHAHHAVLCSQFNLPSCSLFHHLHALPRVQGPKLGLLLIHPLQVAGVLGALDQQCPVGNLLHLMIT